MHTAQRGNRTIAGTMARCAAFMTAACLPAAPLHAAVHYGVQLTLSPRATQTQPPLANQDALLAVPTNCESILPTNSHRPATTAATLISYRSTVDGDLKEATLYRSSGNPDLDNAVLACVKDRRTAPVTINGKPAEVSLILGYEWTPNLGHSFFFEPSPSGQLNNCGAPFPRDLLELHEEGTTRVTFRIGVDGAPMDVLVAQSSGHPSLDRFSVACIESFRFIPATQDGRPVEIDHKPWDMTWQLFLVPF